MTEAERYYFQEYVKEVFHYEHQCSTEILARVLLLCELLIEKGLITDAEVAEIMLLRKELEDQRKPQYNPRREV